MQTRSGKPTDLRISSDGILLVLGFFAVLALLASTETFCFSKATVGLPCPGCGLTRAWLHAFRLDLAGAFHYHPLFMLVPPAVLVAIFRRRGLCRALYASSWFWLGLVVLFVGVWAIRMAVWFPNHEPMEFNRSALMARAWHVVIRFLPG